MATTFTAQIKRFNDKALRNLDLIVKDAAQTTFAKMTEAKDGLMRGAPFETGVVPVDTGDLIASQISGLNGSFSASGENAYEGVVAGMEMGDTVTTAFSSPYSRVIEYGANGVPGRFFVRGALGQWQEAVDAAVAKFGDA